MNVIGIREAKLDRCIEDAQHERVVITRNGKPVALIIGLVDLGLEEVDLGSDDEFWKLISQRRSESTISRAELERRLAAS